VAWTNLLGSHAGITPEILEKAARLELPSHHGAAVRILLDDDIASRDMASRREL
jgi:hypothetical protein